MVRGTAQAHSSSKPSANDTAAAVSFIFRDVNRVMRSPILLLGTVWRLSKFAAQAWGKPSCSVNTTSVGMLRIVDVMGAMVTECNIAIADSRVRISTGRFLSGALNVYQRTSPRFTMRPSLVRWARRRTRLARLACACSPQRDGSRPRELAVAGSLPRVRREWTQIG